MSLVDDLQTGVEDLFASNDGYGLTITYRPGDGDPVQTEGIILFEEKPEDDRLGSRDRAVIWVKADSVTPRAGERDYDTLEIPSANSWEPDIWQVERVAGPVAGFWKCDCRKDARIKA